ncbi:MAG TPA: bifunctional 2-polyprenyl-6-hydroxyphenol methylase/3-demethylubiquinol 3-O-methyltransferase UbiG [Methylovirgula sp.]|jgi:2-polyprenyl-6-hydroxyphenyl methylase/3-demethylubiquinone-9 3-methyltransferase
MPPEDHSSSSVDPDEIARFDRLGEDWWNPKGPMRALHQFNPVRVDYLRRMISHRRARLEGRRTAPADQPLMGVTILDIGCGGGLLSESLARLGATMTAIDPAPTNIEIARRHAEQSGLAIDYRCTTAEAGAEQGPHFDVVLTMEVIEHVREPKQFIAVAASMLGPHGLLVAATLNRTMKSYALAILGAEYVLGWVPKGTHDWAQFVTPRELGDALRAADLHIVDETGVVFDPISGKWRESRDMGVNYMMAAERRG